MTTEQSQSEHEPAAGDEQLDQMVAESDVGGRRPTGIAKRILLGGALVWSLFQIWIASPLPFIPFMSFGAWVALVWGDAIMELARSYLML